MTDSSLHPGRPLDPTRLDIAPGLTELPRQIGLFPAFRAALLEDAGRTVGLAGAGWRGRDVDDFGVMLLEMWAYCCDVLTFYDRFIAGESYLRTAQRGEAVRKLVNLIGYIPRPDVAAQVDLALALEGRTPVTVPAGTAFRSGSFDDEKPQVFTLLNAATLHPLAAKFTLRARPKTAFPSSGGPFHLKTLPFRRGSVTVKVGEAVLVRAGASHFGTTVAAVENSTDAAGNPITRVTFTSTLKIPTATAYTDIRILRPSGRANAWSNSTISSNVKWILSVSSRLVRLETLNKSIKAGERILVRKEDDVRQFRVTRITETAMKIAESTTTSVTGDSKLTITSPAVTTPVTRLRLDVPINATARKAPEYADATFQPDDGNAITVYFGLVEAGIGQGEAGATLDANDPLQVNEAVPPATAPFRPSRFILQDLDERAVSIDGALADDGTLTVADASKWSGSLLPTVTLYAALIRAARGEKVNAELLGAGDGNVAHQKFKLKQQPLTYLPATDAELGVKSTLVLWVDGVKWREVMRFYGHGRDECVYIVRQDDAGDSWVTFGDGLRGARLPTGARVTASYYHGGGLAAPPAKSVTQMVTPVKGVTTLTNPLPAFGGADGEDEVGIKRYAPRSALMLGRAVSLVNYEAVAAATTGVRAARAEWRWSGDQQRPVVQIWIIGAGELAALVRERLVAVSAEGVPFEVMVAQPLARSLAVDVVVDDDYITGDVLAEVVRTLDEALQPERLGIGAALIRSKVLALAAGVPGVVTPLGLALQGVPFLQAGLKAGTGAYFEFTVTAASVVAP